MDVSYEEYYKRLVDQCAFNIACMATVHDTNFEYFAQDDFRVRKPDIKIKVRSILFYLQQSKFISHLPILHIASVIVIPSRLKSVGAILYFWDGDFLNVTSMETTYRGNCCLFFFSLQFYLFFFSFFGLLLHFFLFLLSLSLFSRISLHTHTVVHAR